MLTNGLKVDTKKLVTVRTWCSILWLYMVRGIVLVGALKDIVVSTRSRCQKKRK